MYDLCSPWMLSVFHWQEQKFGLLICSVGKDFGVYMKETENICFLLCK